MRKRCERVVCERWVRDGTDCNILTPTSSDYSSTSFSFCWAAQPGVLRAQALCWELVLTASNCNSNSNKLTPTNWTCLWHRVIWLFDDHLFLVGVAIAPNSTRQRSRLYLDILDWMHLFLDWRLGRRSIFYTSTNIFRVEVWKSDSQVWVKGYFPFKQVMRKFAFWLFSSYISILQQSSGGAFCPTVIAVRNGNGDPSTNHKRICCSFPSCWYSWKRHETICSLFHQTIGK